MTINFKQLIATAEWLSITENPQALGLACSLFNGVLDLFNYIYSNPGEPELECLFCGRDRALPGAYGEAVYTSEELEDRNFVLRDVVYWTRVWATRTLDILAPQHVPCCKERNRLLMTFDL